MILWGCAQRESDVGADSIPFRPGDDFYIEKIWATQSAEWSPRVSNGRGSALQVGDAVGFRSVSALKFSPASLLPDSVVLDTIRLRFKVDRVFPDNVAVPDLRMLIKNIHEPWGEDTLMSGKLLDSASYATIDTILIPTTETGDSAYWNVPDSIWTTWLASDTDSVNYGILLEPENEGVLVAFQSAEGADAYKVQLEVSGTQYYLSDEDSTVVDSSAAYADTIYAVEDGYLTEDSSEPAEGRIRISQGRARRGLFYVPLDSVASPLSTIVRARFHLFVDADLESTVRYQGENPLYKDGTLADTVWFENTDSTKVQFVAASSSSFGSDNVEIVFENTGSVAPFIGHPETNFGFQIQTTQESDVLTRQYFHGPDSEADSLRPYLELWFAQ
jgi:hypothetical protein